MLQGLFQRSLWSLGLRLVNVALAFGVAAFLARALSPPDMGVYFLLMSAAVPLAILAQGGAGTLGLAGVASALAAAQEGLAKERASAALGQALRGGSLVAAACMALAALALGFTGTSAALAVAACGVVAGSLAVQGTASEVLRGFHRTAASTLLAGVLVNALLLPALVAASLHGSVSLGSGLAVVIGCYALAASVAVWMFTRQGFGPARAAGFQGSSRDRRVLVANSLAALIYSSADLWIAGALLSLEDAALYGAASRLSLLLLLPVEAMETATAPLLARAGLEERTSLRFTILRTTQVQTAAVALGVTLLWLAGELVLSIVFGSRYRDASGVLLALATGLGVRAAMGPNGYMLLLTGHARALLKCNLLGVALFVPLEVAAAHWGGLTGLAIAAACATAATNAALAWIVWQRTGFNLTAFSSRRPFAKADPRPS